MSSMSPRDRATNDTRNRILDVALDVLGRNPDAGLAEVAAAAGVVRRTIYGHFPSRTDLIETIARRAVAEMAAVLADVDAPDRSADAVWAEFVDRLWPLTRRYRVLLALRRGIHGERIHALLKPVDTALATLVERGQEDEVFGRHLPADVLGQVAYATVFAIAENELSEGTLRARAATITSLLMLGVPTERAEAVAGSGADGDAAVTGA